MARSQLEKEQEPPSGDCLIPRVLLYPLRVETGNRETWALILSVTNLPLECLSCHSFSLSLICFISKMKVSINFLGGGVPGGMRNLRSQTRDGTRASCSGSTQS